MIARTSGALSPLEPILASRYEPAGLTEAPGPGEQAETFETIESAQAEVSPAAEAQESVNTFQLEGRDPLPAPALAPLANAPREGRTRPAEPRELTEVRPAGKAVTMPDDARQSEKRELSHRTQESPSDPGGREVITETIQSRIVTKSITQERDMFRPEQVVAVPGSAHMAKHGRPDAASSVLPAAPMEVNVTIGAIEVRLAQPAKPAVRKAATPRVSLGDYLSRRNGGPR
jgi:hypothetical protein